MAAFVDGPVRRPLRFGLLSAADVQEDTGPAWRILNGGQWNQLPCDPAGGLEADCDDQDGPGLTTGRGGQAAATGFIVYGEAVCSPVGFTPADAGTAAEAHLQAREEARVEQAVWTGDLGNTPSLRDATDYGTKLRIVLAVAYLDQAIAQSYGSQGVIHMTRSAAVAAVAAGVVLSTQTGGTLRTGAGTPVVAGAGYDGSSPAGVAGTLTDQWIYATPLPVVHRSTIGTSPGVIDTGQNDLMAAAERAYLVGWDDCDVFAVETDLSTITSGV